MTFSDETLTAYADGDLDETTRRSVESAMRRDRSLALRLAHLRAIGPRRWPTTSAATPAPAPVPASSTGVGPQRGAAQVVHLAAVRASRLAQQQAARKVGQRRWGWRGWWRWGALLLSLLMVLAIVLALSLATGKFGGARWYSAAASGSVSGSASGSSSTAAVAPTAVVSRHGTLIAQGWLDTALSQQVGGQTAAHDEVRVGLSFVSNEGGYCRSFTLVGLSQDLLGIACRTGAAWRIPLLVQAARPLRPTVGAADLPTALLEAIDQRIVGGMLTPRAELEALRNRWQR